MKSLPFLLPLLGIGTTADPSGASGWAAAVGTGGVVAWLCWQHIPSLMKTNAEHLAALIKAHNDDRAAWAAGIDKVLTHCREERDDLLERFAPAPILHFPTGYTPKPDGAS